MAVLHLDRGLQMKERRMDTDWRKRLLTLLSAQAGEIYAAWLAAVKERWGEESGPRERRLAAEREEKKDLFSLLLQFLAGRESETVGAGGKTKSRLLDDFLAETALLEKAAADVLGRTRKIPDMEERGELAKRLQETFAALIRETIGAKLKTYEQIVEGGQRGFCLVDPEGRILHVNKKMEELMGPGELEGRLLSEFFCRDDIDFLREALKRKSPPIPLQITSPEGRILKVGVEIGPLYLNEIYQGAYVCLVDLSSVSKGRQKIYDHFPQGIIHWKVPAVPDPEKAIILYANAKASEIAGYHDLKNMNLKTLFPEGEDLRILQEQIEKRGNWEGDEYKIEMTTGREMTPGEKEKIPLWVSSIPEEMDLDAEKIVSVITIIRSLVREHAIEDMHEAIESSRRMEEIFQKVTEVLKKLFPFDLFQVYIHSPDLQYIRRLFPGPDVEPKSEVRWWKAPEKVIEWLKAHKEVTIINRLELLDEITVLKEDEEVRSFPPFPSQLYKPVIRKESVVASINLFHMDKKIYLPEHKELLEALPLDKAVLLSLSFEEMANLEFRLNFIKNLTLVFHQDIKSLYRRLLIQLASHYNWQNVSLFEVDEAADKIRLLEQTDTSWKLDDGFEQELHGEKGILAYVGREKKPVNIADVKKDQIAKKYYVEVFPNTKSELCLPIRAGFGWWLLNIEDDQKQAFSPMEQKDLTEEIIPELEMFLERLWEHFVFNAIRESTSDMIIVTDNCDRIQMINPAACRALKFAQEEVIGKPFKKLFAKAEVFTEMLMEQTAITNQEVEFKDKDDHKIKVLLSGAKFPQPGIRGKFYSAKNITFYEPIKEFTGLREVVEGMANQARTALSLAFSWLDNLTEADPEMVDKIRRQLHKVESTFDRFALYEGAKEIKPNKLLLRVSEVLDQVEDQFPKSEFQKISIERDPESQLLRGDLGQLVFCLTSILSYLGRYLPEEEKIHLAVVPEGDKLCFKISGFWPETSLEKTLDRVKFELALGEKAIMQFMANQGGEFEKTILEGKDRINFVLRLPAVTGEDDAL